MITIPPYVTACGDPDRAARISIALTRRYLGLSRFDAARRVQKIAMSAYKTMPAGEGQLNWYALEIAVYAYKIMTDSIGK